jgi:hypothetical protein
VSVDAIRDAIIKENATRMRKEGRKSGGHYDGHEWMDLDIWKIREEEEARRKKKTSRMDMKTKKKPDDRQRRRSAFCLCIYVPPPPVGSGAGTRCYSADKVVN